MVSTRPQRRNEWHQQQQQVPVHHFQRKNVRGRNIHSTPVGIELYERRSQPSNEQPATDSRNRQPATDRLQPTACNRTTATDRLQPNDSNADNSNADNSNADDSNAASRKPTTATRNAQSLLNNHTTGETIDPQRATHKVD
jgi:hypothetical protein